MASYKKREGPFRRDAKVEGGVLKGGSFHQMNRTRENGREHFLRQSVTSVDYEGLRERGPREKMHIIRARESLLQDIRHRVNGT